MERIKENVENALGYKIWIGSEANRGSDPNTIYICV